MSRSGWMTEEENRRRSGGRHSRKNKARVFSLSTQDGELTCEVVVKRKVMSALIETGACIQYH